MTEACGRSWCSRVPPRRKPRGRAHPSWGVGVTSAQRDRARTHDTFVAPRVHRSRAGPALPCSPIPRLRCSTSYPKRRDGRGRPTRDTMPCTLRARESTRSGSHRSSGTPRCKRSRRRASRALRQEADRALRRRSPSGSRVADGARRRCTRSAKRQRAQAPMARYARAMAPSCVGASRAGSPERAGGEP